jgi:phage terminase small subunit
MLINRDVEPNGTPREAPGIVEARRRLFAIHMAACENSAKAARLAGYSDHPGTSRSTGSRLMQDPAVVAMVEEERQARAHRLRVSEERIVEAYAAIAFGDFRSVVRYRDGRVEITPSDDLTDDEAMLVASIETSTRTDRDGNVTVTTMIKLENRQQAIEALARIKGMLRDRLEVDHGEPGIADEMAELRERRRARLAASNKAQPVDAVAVLDGDDIGSNRSQVQELREVEK